MGDVESGGGTWDGAPAADAGGTGGSHSMSGGSLPPRKRLLAGLKQQNGGYLGSSSPSASAVTSPASVLNSSVTSGAAGAQSMEVVASLDSTLDGAGVSGTVVAKHEDGCMSCGGPDGGAGWRRIKRSGVFHRLCNPCALLFGKNMCCPYCLVGYHELSQMGDPAVWLLCTKCRRSVHVDCELKQASRTKTDPASYVCPECSQPRRHRESANGFKSRGFSSRVGTNSAPEAGQCMSSAAAECSSPSHKKLRMSREPRVRLIDHAATHPHAERATMDGGAGPASATKPGLSAASRKHHMSPISAEEAAAAAKAAAAAATRAAAAAKATAAAKASVAVKAAAAAKAALEAAALAARAEAQARAELRRNSSRSDVRATMTSKLTRESSGNSKKDKMESRPDKLEVKTEKGEDGRALHSPMDDSELARQLHREINSSPRISRSLTPMRRKAPGRLVPAPASSGGSPVMDGAARVWPRSGTPTEPPRSQPKQQQTRPRSVMSSKDGKRVDARIAGQEYNRPEDEGPESGAPTSDFEKAAYDSLQHLEPDVQSMEEDKAESPVVEADPCFPPDTTGDLALSTSVPEVYRRATDVADNMIQDGQVSNEACMPTVAQGGIGAADPAEPLVAGDGAAGSSDIVMDGDFRVDASRWEQQSEALSLMATLIAEEEDYRGRDQEMDDQLTAEEIAQVTASVSAEAQQHMEGLDPVHTDTQLVDVVDAEDGGAALEAGVVVTSDPTVQSDTLESLSPHTTVQAKEQAGEALREEAVSPRPTFLNDTVESLTDTERDIKADESNTEGTEPSQRNGSAENGGRTSSLAVAGNGESWHPTKLKGLATGGQAFAGGVFGPAATLPVRTPAFASGATGRHL